MADRATNRVLRRASRVFARALILATSAIGLSATASAQTKPAAPPPSAAAPAAPDEAESTPTPEAEPAKTPQAAAKSQGAAEPAAAATPSDTVTAPPQRPDAPELVASAPTAKAATPAAESRPDDGLMGSHRDHVLGTLGMRVGYIPNEGLDPFSTNDVLSQFSLGIGSTVYGQDDFSLAALLLWDTGGTSADARGDEAKLFTHRLTVGGEGRYHFFRRFYTYARLAPGVVRWDASLEDDSVGYERSAGNWMFALDVSAGTAVEFAGEARGKSNRPRGWLSAEAGYGWTTASKMTFESDEENQVPARVESLTLHDLALRGGFFRIAANLTY